MGVPRRVGAIKVRVRVKMESEDGGAGEADDAQGGQETPKVLKSLKINRPILTHPNSIFTLVFPSFSRCFLMFFVE
jgi:hypothetical protein